MSVDALANKYASFSPYNAMLNNPIRLIDPDGNDIIDIIIKKSEWKNNGSKPLLVVEGEFTVKVKVYNASSSSINMGDFAADVKKMMDTELNSKDGKARSSYFSVTDNKDYINGTFFKDKKMKDFDVSATFKINVEVEVVKSLDQLKENDSAIILTDYIVKRSGQLDVVGQYYNNGISLVEANNRTTEQMVRTAAHEELHDMGVADNYKRKNGKVTDPGSGLMGTGNGTHVKDAEMGQMYRGVLETFWSSKKYGKGDGNKIYNGDKQSRSTQAKDTLSKNGKKK